MNLVILLTAFLVLLPAGTQARTTEIVATVNQDAITDNDLQNRMKLIMASSGLPDAPEVRSKLRPQIMTGLIEESLRMQEAERLGLDATDEEVNNGFAMIAKDNNLTTEQFRKVLSTQNVPFEALRDQIRAQILWTKVIQSTLQPKIEITENDLDDALERLQSRMGEPEYLLAEIFLPIDPSQGEAETVQLANRLTAEMKKGAPFMKLAQQFSQSAGASRGGDLGWIRSGQMPAEVDAVLPTLETGKISDPIKSLNGYYILLLRDKRTMTNETLPSREELTNRLGMERLERMQRRYLQDLKSAAFIDKRG